jgi:hypothetical protein
MKNIIDLNELNSRKLWQALGKDAEVKGSNPLEAAEMFYEKYPKSRAPITVREIIAYDYLDSDTGKLVPMYKVIFGVGGTKSYGNITKKTFRAILTNSTAAP